MKLKGVASRSINEIEILLKISVMMNFMRRLENEIIYICNQSRFFIWLNLLRPSKA
jgi:hypothetical protein